MRNIIFIFLFFTVFQAASQTFTTDPQFPAADQPVTLTVDVTGTSLEGYTGDVWLWTWISQGCTSNCDAPTNIDPATATEDEAKMTRIGSDIYTITFTPTEFFNKPAEELQQIGFKLKSGSWSDNIQSDVDQIITFYEQGELTLVLNEPSDFPAFVDPGASFNISAISSIAADLSISIEGKVMASVSNSSEIEYQYTVGVSGKYYVEITAELNGNSISEKFYFLVRQPTVTESKPAEIIEGINYFPDDPTTASLVLKAPGKSSVYVIGSFTNWEVDPSYQMKKDGDYFWLTIEGLNEAEKYPFQYFVDEEIYIADPYTDVVIDPDDYWIPTSQNNSFLPYPEDALQTEWYFNRLSVIETGQEEYQWQNDKVFIAPDSLIIYELLIRDFFENGERTYANLTDTLSYLKALGVNAVQLMPIMEFNGNESWGYNPTFMFAPDKYYGTKEEFKAFVDAAHGMNMAVILDLAMNHQDMPNSFLMLDFNYTSFTPTVDNPYFNQVAKHPFNVFFDMNHESAYTQDYLDSINHYWLNEYNVDGFRFDLSKGFTQKNSGADVGAWSAYDQSRIDLLKRMADEIRSHSPKSTLILEHFAANNEEKVLSDYGFLLWGNLNHNYAQATMGYSEGSTVSGVYYKNRGWNEPHLVGYAESHDEERLVYRLKNFGHVSVKETKTALERAKAASTFFYTIPGPKMIWQWGEWGYGRSIDENGRTGIKPIPWNDIDGLSYFDDPLRQKLYRFNKEILNLRRDYKVFSLGAVTTFREFELLKQVTLRSNPYTSTPTDPAEMNVVIVGNFDVAQKDLVIEFPHSGTWHNYFAPSESREINSLQHTESLAAGEFIIFTDVELPAPEPELTIFADPNAPELLILEEVAGKGIQVSWADNSTIEKSYVLLKSDDGITYEELSVLGPDTQSVLDAEVMPNKTYYYKVVAKGASSVRESNALSIQSTNAVTGVIEVGNSTLNYYPNPTKDILTLESPLKGTYIIYNQVGMCIESGKLANGRNIIVTEGFSKGMFLIKVILNDRSEIIKILKE